MKRWRQKLWQWRGALITTPTVAGVVILLRCIGLLQTWEWAVYDQYLRLRPAETRDERIVIVGLDEYDLAEIGQATVPDGVLATLLDEVRSQSPRAIGLDLYRDLPLEPGHQELVEVFESTPQLVGIRKVVGEAGRETVAPPPALAALGQVGANDLINDADNTVRRGILSVDDETGETVYSLALYLALLYLEPEGIGPEMIDDDRWALGQVVVEPFAANDGGYTRADDNGYQTILNYRGPANSFETVSFRQVLNGEVEDGWARDRIVLIGALGESFQDLVFTPHSSQLLSLPEPMPGVEVHAHLTSQLISGALDGRPFVRSWPEPLEWAWIFAWSGMGAGLVCQFSQMKLRQVNSRYRQRWLRGVLVLLAIGGLGGSTFFSFSQGYWIPVVPAGLAAVGSATAIMGFVARSAADIRRTFGRYLTDEIVTTLLENPEGQKLGGERRTITLLTSDLRGFTATSERLPPETVIRVLNFYLGRMAEVITRHQGTIDEFMGDGILILFGAPITRDDDAQRAVACAVEMQLAMASVNETVESWGLAPLEMGIGIHTGEVVVGNIGSEKRTKYGVVGSPVNLTYRIESFTTGGQILISHETRQIVGELAHIRAEQSVMPKGVAQPITIYDLGGVDAPYHLSLPTEEECFYILPGSIQLKFRTLSGKHIKEACSTGRLVQLSDKGAQLVLDNPEEDQLSALVNLKLNLSAVDLKMEAASDYTEDVYAKVITAEADGSFIIRFTAKPPAVTEALEQVYQKLVSNMSQQSTKQQAA